MATCCETCGNYQYDDEYDMYECEVNLDEDELYRFMSHSDYNCPYYTNGDEYKIVRKQM